MLGRKDLRVYQVFFIGKIKQCLALIDRIPGLILALEPGAGKTTVVLTAALDLLLEGLIRRVLIVAPLLVAQTVWPAEIDDWEHLQGLTWTLIRVEDDDADVAAAGRVAYDEALARYQAFFDQDFLLPAKQTRALFGPLMRRMAEGHRQRGQAREKLRKLAALANQDTQIHIINKEALDWLWAHMGEGKKVPYDLLVLDDLREGRSGRQRAKRDEANRKNAPLSRFGILARMRKHVKATIQLTGTPTPGGLHNLWGLTYLIDLGRRLGTAQSTFNKKYFEQTEYWKPGRPLEGAFDTIMGKVKDIMFSLDPRDYPQLPPFVIDPIRIRLPEAVLTEYKKFNRTLVSEEYDVEAVNAGVHHSKLLQFANGSMYQEDGNDVWIHDVKIEALRLLVERLNGTPLLVAYTYQFDADRILAKFPQAVLLRPENAVETVKAWNRDEVPLLLAHRASAGHGLNMQKGTGHMCEYGLTSDAELYLQFIKRICRPGRNTKVFNHVLIAEGTIDEQIFPRYLDPKIEMQLRVMRETQVTFGDHPEPSGWTDGDLDLLG